MPRQMQPTGRQQIDETNQAPGRLACLQKACQDSLRRKEPNKVSPQMWKIWSFDMFLHSIKPFIIASCILLKTFPHRKKPWNFTLHLHGQKEHETSVPGCLQALARNFLGKTDWRVMQTNEQRGHSFHSNIKINNVQRARTGTAALSMAQKRCCLLLPCLLSKVHTAMLLTTYPEPLWFARPLYKATPMHKTTFRLALASKWMLNYKHTICFNYKGFISFTLNGKLKETKKQFKSNSLPQVKLSSHQLPHSQNYTFQTTANNARGISINNCCRWFGWLVGRMDTKERCFYMSPVLLYLTHLQGTGVRSANKEEELLAAIGVKSFWSEDASLFHHVSLVHLCICIIWWKQWTSPFGALWRLGKTHRNSRGGKEKKSPRNTSTSQHILPFIWLTFKRQSEMLVHMGRASSTSV